ncbi:hypothetical protein I4F81_009421 [Pyropia yezoensis]|uniref:Uncharacterized protein n=1 Tax=Pyropia yezoensis TaxID=2788 RepID=A0ACC3C9S6_PYRYE|nr:hypothetical protein I4F81_009421 [Neopyropia yezoensis]
MFAEEDVYGGQVARFHMPHFLHDALPAVVALSVVREREGAYARACWRSPATKPSKKGGAAATATGTWDSCAGVEAAEPHAEGSVLVAPQLRALGPTSWVTTFLRLCSAEPLHADDAFPGAVSVPWAAALGSVRNPARGGGSGGGGRRVQRLACFRSVSRTRLPGPATPTSPIIPLQLLSKLELFTTNGITKEAAVPQWRGRHRGGSLGGNFAPAGGVDGEGHSAAGRNNAARASIGVDTAATKSTTGAPTTTTAAAAAAAASTAAAAAAAAAGARAVPRDAHRATPPPPCTLRLTLLNRMPGYPRHIPRAATLLAALRNASTPTLRLVVSSTTFEGTPLAYQVDVMQRTDVLVAAHGAGITNALFLRSASSLVEVSPFGYAAGIFPWLARSVAALRYERVIAAPDPAVFAACLRAAFGVAAATFTAVTGVGAAKKKKGEPPAGMVGKAAATLAGTVLSGGKGGNVRRWGGAGAGLLGGLRSKAGIAAALGLTNAAGVGTTLRSLPPAVKLLVCVGLDGAGFLLGDVADVAYAPLLAAALQGLFGDARVTAAGVAEETVPGRGNVPTATLAWCAERAGLLRKAEKGEVEEDAAELEAMREELRDLQRGDDGGGVDAAAVTAAAAAKEKERS